MLSSTMAVPCSRTASHDIKQPLAGIINTSPGTSLLDITSHDSIIQHMHISMYTMNLYVGFNIIPTGWDQKISVKIVVSWKYVNIFASNFAHLFSRLLSTSKSDYLHPVYIEQCPYAANVSHMFMLRCRKHHKSRHIYRVGKLSDTTLHFCL